MDEPVRIRLLGPLEAEVGGAPVDLGGPRQRAVLALLLVARGEVVSLDRLIDDLWRGEPPPRATGALQAYVSNLRRALEPGRRRGRRPRVLVSAAPGYAVRLPETDVDGWRVRGRAPRRLPDATPAPPSRSSRTLLGRGAGGACAEFAQRAVGGARGGALRRAARGRARAAGRRPHPPPARAEAVVEAEALVREARCARRAGACSPGPVRGRPPGRRAGDAAPARDLLADELGIDPGPRLLDLERAVLTQTVDVPATGRPGRARPRHAGRRRPGTARDAACSSGARPNSRRCTGRPRPPRGPEPSVVLVAGEAGAGKSALLGRRRARAGRRGLAGRGRPLPRVEPAGRRPGRGRRSSARAGRRGRPGPVRRRARLRCSRRRPGRDGRRRDRRRRAGRPLPAAPRRADWLSELGDRPLASCSTTCTAPTTRRSAAAADAARPGRPGRVLVVLALPSRARPGWTSCWPSWRPRTTRSACGWPGWTTARSRELIETVTGTAPDPTTVVRRPRPSAPTATRST